MIGVKLPARFPHTRFTRNGCALLVYRGGGENSRPWHRVRVEQVERDWECTQRRLRWRVVHGGRR